MGTPVIATDCPWGPAEILEQGRLWHAGAGRRRGRARAGDRERAGHRRPGRRQRSSGRRSFRPDGSPLNISRRSMLEVSSPDAQGQRHLDRLQRRAVLRALGTQCPWPGLSRISSGSIVDDGSTDRTAALLARLQARGASGAGGLARTVGPGARPQPGGRSGAGRLRRQPGLRRRQLPGPPAAAGRVSRCAPRGRRGRRPLPGDRRAARRALRAHAARGPRADRPGDGEPDPFRPHRGRCSARRPGARPAVTPWSTS